ncbi:MULTISPECIES: SPOR domain-containing protein [Rhizobium]|uniref:SPOR domain-containing protein n=1 Tax=Rhizobium phaseoli TaxID=396 RepID=A0A192TBC6_9HYPH|nr:MULTISPECIES: SPOR domain-containing protein [Rhizobium]ANL40306.1 sporulation related domain-containing protein [Rhizobium phaseoli]ANL53062.1 sporulation related domain-containing protein [Rhizobium phaseoli]ANL59295.1 sporulation related domain-containing protein [Rhizobium phaseoli]ANL84710.1 sporulation related domain-containing protein [Rhizobium phaseoli]ANL91217.1 sporulation related domain-containing protein [Rhizobium phaseoli]
MAEKQLAYDTRGKDDLFADDDPLAELARIVGFEPRVAANTVSEAARREPALDLEDELGREFDRYDSPRPLAELDHPAEPISDGFAPEDYVEPVLDAAPAVERVQAPEPVSVASVADEEAAQPAAGNWDVAAADWRGGPQPLSVDPVSEAPTQAAFGGARDLIEELELSIGAAPVSSLAQPAKAPQWSAASIRLPLANFHAPKREEPVAPPVDVVEPAAETVAAPVAKVADEPVAETSLADSVAVEPQPAVEQSAPVAAVEPAEEFVSASPSFGFPAELDRHDEAIAPQETAEAEEFFAVEDGPDEFSSDAGFDLAAAVEGEIQADAALTEVVPDVPHTAGTFDLDDLLADVSRYPVPHPVLQRANLAPVSPQPAAEAAPVAAAPVQTAPVVAAPVLSAPVERVPAHVAEVAKPVAPQPADVTAPQPAATAYAWAPQPAPEADDPFAGHDFELDLAGIELELADLDFSEASEPAPQPQPQPQPAPAAPQQATAPTRSTPVFAAEPPAVAPAPVFNWSPAPEAPAPEAPAAESTEDLPFDPAMISDPEERPETVDDMHVPALPPVEQPAPVAKTADFDFDLDAEIASFFEPAKPREVPASPRDTAVAAKPVKPTIADGLDDFERALEEDFRRSVREPVERRETSEVHIESASQAADFSRARSMRRLLAGAVVLVVFAGVGYGVYSSVWNGEGLGIVASGEPRVITADKEPVKVVPENPGGKTVPNQDKAVYDRVAGSAEEPKQKALVSSDEAPVDVVQRTLTPEALPEDDENAGAEDRVTPTAVGETEDPRLLPNQATADDASASGADKTPSVSPRKVRTMIVKPDGTLVARDEIAPLDQPEPAAKSAQTPPSAQPPVTAQSAPSTPAVPPATGTAASFPASAEVASVDARSAAPAESAPAQGSPAATADAQTANPAPVDAPARPVKTTTIADTAPIPTARPADQPVNVVGTVTDKGNVRTPAQQPKPTQVASATPAAAQPQQAASAGGYGLQIASLPSEDEANKSYASLSKKFAGVLSGRAHEIRKADIAGKGTFYRVRIPVGSKDEAAALCEKYRAAGGSCLISK